MTPQQEGAADDRQRAHAQRRGEAMPDRKVEVGQGATDHGAGDDRDQRLRYHRHQSDDNDQHHQQGRRQIHARRRIVRVMRVVVALRPEEDMEDVAEGVGDREDGPQGRRGG